jgi:hypothetical protein
MKEAAMVETERRRELRHRTLKLGHIAFNRAGTIDCRVRNLSSLGAGLEVASQLGIPDEFLLLVEHGNINQRCRVAWRNATQMGVEFVAVRAGTVGDLEQAVA